MIRKLLKYDMRGIGRRLLPLYALAIALSVINAFSINNIDNYSQPEWVQIMSVITMMMYGVTIFALFFMTIFIFTSKYARSVYGEEGYLTNTLPIKQSTIITSKLLGSYLWMVISGIVALISVLILALSIGDLAMLLREFGRAWAEFVKYWSELPGAIRLSVTTFMVSGLISSATQILTIFLAIGIGNRFRHKLTAGAIAYIGITAVLGYISSLILDTYMSALLFMPTASVVGMYSGMPSASWVTLAVVCAEFAAIFFATKYIQERHLNLD